MLFGKLCCCYGRMVCAKCALLLALDCTSLRLYYVSNSTVCLLSSKASNGQSKKLNELSLFYYQYKNYSQWLTGGHTYLYTDALSEIAWLNTDGRIRRIGHYRTGKCAINSFILRRKRRQLKSSVTIGHYFVLQRPTCCQFVLHCSAFLCSVLQFQRSYTHTDTHPHAGSTALPAPLRYVLFCSVLQPSSIRGLAASRTTILQCSRFSVALKASSNVIPVHALILSCQAVLGLPVLFFQADSLPWFPSPGSLQS